MKKIIVSLFVLLSISLSAQETATGSTALVQLPKFQFGVKVGATNSNVTVDWNNLNDLPKQKWGYQVGLVTRYNALDWMRLNGYFDFLQKGFEIPDRLPSDATIREKVEAFGNLFQMSFDAQFIPIENMGVHIGPYLSYWQTGKAIMERSGDNITTQTIEYEVQAATGDLDPNNIPANVLLINPWDFGITGALSYQFGKIGATVKYELGLADLNNLATGLKNSSLFKFDGNSNAEFPPTKFRTLSITLVYWIN